MALANKEKPMGGDSSVPHRSSFSRFCLALVCLCCLVILQLWDYLKLQTAGDTSRADEQVLVKAEHGGNLLRLHDDNLYEVIPPEHLFNNKVVYTSIICSYDGSCNTTGLVNRRIRYTRDIKKACFLKDGSPIASEFLTLKLVAHEKDDVKLYAANTYHQLLDFNNSGIPKYPNEFRAICSLKNTSVPVLMRSVSKYNNKIVLLVTQYYSKVRLEWMKIWLDHYFDMGVDIVAIYGGFDVSKHEQYSKEMYALIESTRFKDKVHFFRWDRIAELETWAHSQASMLNHGASFFRGSIILATDLDELVVPFKYNSIKEMARHYDNKYGTWSLQFLSFEHNGYDSTREKIFDEYAQGTLDFQTWARKAKKCYADADKPHQCRAKSIFHSLDVATTGVHKAHFFTKVNRTEAWLNSKIAIVLHLRGVQRYWEGETEET